MLMPGRNSNLVAYNPRGHEADAALPLMTAASDAYLAASNARLALLAPDLIAQRIVTLVHDTDAWRESQCLNLNAAENTVSARTRALLDSDLATRVTEGFPGDKEFPPTVQNAAIDEIEATLIHLARRLFGVAHVEWRPVSTSMAFATMLQATTKAGDTILVQSMEGGGSMTYSPDGPPGWQGIRVVEIPSVGYFEIDLDAARRLALANRPRLIVVGGSYALFAPQFRALRAIADEVGARLVFDAAHVSLYGAVGLGEEPFASGVDIMFASTHKILGGPVGGLILTPHAEIARAIFPLSFPGFVQTRDQNKFAATAHSLAEMVAHGARYAKQTIANARALAEALHQRGYRVLAGEREWTQTHQLFVDVADLGAREVEARCQQVGLLLHAAHMMGDSARGARTGLRITVQEVTRRGMMATDMATIASLIDQAIRGTDDVSTIAAAVAATAGNFPRVVYTFDD